MYFRIIRTKKNMRFFANAGGFTLIEVIVTLVVAAILGSMLTTFMQTGIAESAKNVLRVYNTYDIVKIMENIRADYLAKLAADATPLATIKTKVGTQGNIVNNAYGSYKVINNNYITFTCSGGSCTESTGGSSILKVTIADSGDTQSITALFTQ